jgi:copper(I)-binding protein
MFVGLKQPAKQGERFKGTLTFEHAGSVEVDYAVEAIGGKPAGKPAKAEGTMDHGTADHSTMDHGAADHGSHAK